MTTATAQKIEVDRDELRDIAIDVSAMTEYMNDLLGDGDGPLGAEGPEKRLEAINTRLEALLGQTRPDDGTEPSVEWQEEDEALFQAASTRGTEWFKEDREEIFDLVGKKIGSCLRLLS